MKSFIRCGWTHRKGIWNLPPTERLSNVLCGSLTEENEAGLDLDILWSVNAYSHNVFFSRLSLTFPCKSSEMKVYLTDWPVMEMDASEIFQAGYNNPPVSSTTNPSLILDAGYSWQRKGNTEFKVRWGGSWPKNPICRDYLWPTPAHMEVHCFYHLEFPREPVWKEK